MGFTPVVSRRSGNVRNLRIRYPQLAAILLLTAILFVMVMPFFMMTAISLDETANRSLKPISQIRWSDVGFRNYQFIYENYQFMKYFRNTIIVTAVSIVITLASAIFSGYAYSMLEFPFKKTIFLFCVSAMLIPGALLIVPSYLLIKWLGLYDSYLALWLPLFGSVYYFFFSKQFFDSLPGELRLAAQVDGLPELKILLLIYLPMCGPIISTLGILQFIGVYNDLLGPLIYLKTEAKYTLTIKLAFLTTGRNSAANGVNMALSVATVIPILLVFSFFQRYIMESIAATGIKD
jgi:multiple sugar transport system permease protein